MNIFADIPKSVRVWSLDGGGRGVLSQLIIIDNMMRLIQQNQKLNAVPRPCNHADVMIGTGFGGLATILMGRLRLTASEAYDDIVQIGQSVFTKPNTSSSKPLFSLDTLKSTLGSILERHGYKSNTMMIEDNSLTQKCHVIILASAKANAAGYKCLRTYISSKSVSCTVVDAIAATMAVPDWFDPVTVGDGHEKQVLIGGSMGYNNPTWEGLLEAKKIFGVDARVTSLISIGSGKAASITPAATKDQSGCVEQMNVDCEQTAIRLAGYFRDVPAYFRIVADGPVDNTDVSNWDEGSNVLMNGQTTSYLERVEVQKNLDKVIANLLQETGVASLGQLVQAATTRISARSVPRLTPYYVSRPEVNDFMEKVLTEDDTESQKMVIIHGMGGSGKTQSASFFERKNRKRYKHIFFIDASSVTNIKADLQSAIRSLGGAHSQDTFEDALQYLRSAESGDCLVIFDNADDPNLSLIEFIPSCDRGHIIVTTRNPDLALLAPSSHLRMPIMDDSEALAVLFLATQTLRPESQADNGNALEICRLVGHLPLALVQVGCYCFSSQVSLAHYLDRFREHRQRLMEHRPSWRLDEYPHSAYTSISLSYSLLDDTVKSFLHLLAFFYPSNIQIDILRISAKHHFDVDPDGQLVPRGEQDGRWLKDLENILLTDGEWNQTRMDELLMRLQSLSLLSLARDDDYTTATIHPLVQSFVQDILGVEDFNRFLYMATRTLSGCIWDEYKILFRHLPPHVYEIENHKPYLDVNDSTAFAYLFWSMALYHEALPRWRKAKVGCDELLGSGHDSTLFAAGYVSSCLREINDYKAAAFEITSAIAIQERNTSRDHDKTIDLYSNFATLLTYQEKTKEAESILQTNLQIFQSRYGKEHRDTLLTSSELGLNLYEQGKFYEAETILDEVIPIMMRVFGEDSINTSKAIARLCRVLMKLGRWAEAESRLQHLLSWRVKNYGAETIFTAVIIQDLALCSQHHGDLKEAERLQRFALGLLMKHRGPGNKETIKAQNALKETVRLINEANSDSDDAHANRTRVWNNNRVEFIILFVLMAMVAALLSYSPFTVVFR